MHPRTIPAAVALLAVLAIVALAACGPGGAPSGAPASTPSAAATSAAPSDAASEEPSASEDTAPSGSAAAGDVTVMVAGSELGEILVDAEGMVLYGFTLDEETGETTCYEDCAAAWPPLLEDGEITVGAGLDDADFSLIDRTDGDVQQVRVGGWPLYYFAGDSAPGDTNGQGLQGVWYVVSPEGELIGR